MLIEFSVTNFRSILERQTLSMAASSYFGELEEANTFDAGAGTGTLRLLRSAALYGPNASGKSTLIKALSFMETQVRYSQQGRHFGDEIDVVPFKLTDASIGADSTFEIILIEGDVRYEYGFSCNRQRFTEEWLTAYPKGRPQKWFHRVFDAAAEADVYKFGTSFLGARLREGWSLQTRQNALFLSTAVQLNNEQLKPVFNWFNQKLIVLGAMHSLSARTTLNELKDPIGKHEILNFMNAADLSLADIEIRPSYAPREGLSGGLTTAFSPLEKPVFIHSNTQTGAPVELSESEESQGTLALFAFAGMWMHTMKNEHILVVDELDSSLHPLVVQHLVKRLHHAGTKAQLVFTTHDATLLSQSLFRRDQVWFMEKDKNNATRLYPLSDFSPRENEAIERGYLNGRYGAIPFLKDLDFYGVG